MNNNRSSILEKLLKISSMPVGNVISILRAKHLIPSSCLCFHCRESLTEAKRWDCIDKVTWVCRNRQCTKKNTKVSIRKDTFLYGFRISLADVWTVVIRWMTSMQISEVVREHGICRDTVRAIYARLRSLVKQDPEADPIRLGGPGIICQIDESLFSHKQKYHRGRVSETQSWVFGIADTSTSPARFYMEVVEARNAETLLPIIARVCRPGTVIHSDQWDAYR